MKKWTKWILILIGIIIIGLIIWKIMTYQEKYFKNIVIEDNYIFNTIQNKNYLDTIVYAGIKTLNIDSLIIIIKPLSETSKNEFSIDTERDLKAKIKGKDNTYIIYINDNMSRESYINILSHELIHLEQYYTKKLEIIDNKVFWKNQEIDLSKYLYENRPWEKEASLFQNNLEKEMLQLLY